LKREAQAKDRERVKTHNKNMGGRHGKQHERKDTLDEIIEEENQNQTQGVTKNEKLQETNGGLTRDEKGKEKETNTEDSEDSGPYFNDILSPGGTHLSFGDFKTWKSRTCSRCS
jgi:hypothetical protein